MASDDVAREALERLRDRLCQGRAGESWVMVQWIYSAITKELAALPAPTAAAAQPASGERAVGEWYLEALHRAFDALALSVASHGKNSLSETYLRSVVEQTHKAIAAERERQAKAGQPSIPQRDTDCDDKCQIMPMRAEIAELREQLDDWKDSAARAAGEPCGDEKHCTCVGPLRQKVEDQKTAIRSLERAYADLRASGNLRAGKLRQHKKELRRTYAEKEQQLIRQGEVIADLRAKLAAAEAVIARHDLCHNLHGKVDARAFADGCADEQRKLYGCAPDVERAEKAEAERDAKQRVLDAIHDTLREAGYDLPLQEQVGAVIQDRDTYQKAMLNADELLKSDRDHAIAQRDAEVAKFSKMRDDRNAYRLALSEAEAKLHAIEVERDTYQKAMLNADELLKAERDARDPKRQRQPDGYAYRYPHCDGSTTIRFNGGESVNGSKPIEAVPYWLGRPLLTPEEPKPAPYRGGHYTEPLPPTETKPAPSARRPITPLHLCILIAAHITPGEPYANGIVKASGVEQDYRKELLGMGALDASGTRLTDAGQRWFESILGAEAAIEKAKEARDG